MNPAVQTPAAKLLDVIAILKDLPEHHLVIGQVGTIVECYSPDFFEIEFCTSEGRTLALAEMNRVDFLVLRHEAEIAA